MIKGLIIAGDAVQEGDALAKVNLQSVTNAMVDIQSGIDELDESLEEVETGVADGDNVEILSGLSDGDKIYYRYADTLSYTFLND